MGLSWAPALGEWLGFGLVPGLKGLIGKRAWFRYAFSEDWFLKEVAF